MSGDSAPIRILAVDDPQLVREGIAGFLAVQSDMTLVAEAANGREAIQQFRTIGPTVKNARSSSWIESQRSH